MRVKTLIQQLQKCDPEAEVLCLCCDDNPLNGDGFDINRVFSIIYTDENETTVYIDGTVE